MPSTGGSIALISYVCYQYQVVYNTLKTNLF